MKLQTTGTLSDKQKKQILSLWEACADAEQIRLRPSLEDGLTYTPSLPAFYLLYERDMLVSFAELSVPTPESGEIMGFTHPVCRRRGYFTALWETVLSRLSREDILEDMELVFVTDGKSPDALAALAAMEGEYAYGEYFLEKALPEEPALPADLMPLSGEDLDMASEMHEEIFCEGERASDAFVREILSDPASLSFLYAPGGDAAGLFHLSPRGEDVYLSGFGILPEKQGKGLGKAMLAEAEAQAARMGRTLFLQVGDYNEAAFALYKGAGYAERSHLEYYE